MELTPCRSISKSSLSSSSSLLSCTRYSLSIESCSILGIGEEFEVLVKFSSSDSISLSSRRNESIWNEKIKVYTQVNPQTCKNRLYIRPLNIVLGLSLYLWRFFFVCFPFWTWSFCWRGYSRCTLFSLLALTHSWWLCFWLARLLLTTDNIIFCSINLGLAEII